jgi:hypothetical protein
MKRSIRIMVGFLFLTLCSAIPCFAKEWRGIVPLHSTRADVLKILGDPKHTWETATEYYDLADEKVTIKWIDPTCERKYPVESEVASRPDDIVLAILVYPKKPLPSKELDIPAVGYMTLGCHPNGPCTVWSSEVGFGYTTSKGGVTNLHYEPSDAEFKAWLNDHKACQPSIKSAT